MAGEQIRRSLRLTNTSGIPQEVTVRMTSEIRAIESIFFFPEKKIEHRGTKRISITVPPESVFLTFALRAVPGAESGCTSVAAVIERPGLKGSFHEIGRIQIAENLCVIPSLIFSYTPPSFPEGESVVLGKPFTSTLRVENPTRVMQPFCIIPEVIGNGVVWNRNTINNLLNITLSPPLSSINPPSVKLWEEMRISRRTNMVIEVEVTILPIGNPPQAFSISFKARGFLDC